MLIFILLSSLVVSCALFGSLKKAPTGFVKTNDVGWSSIQLRDDLKFDKAFDAVLDVVAKRFEMDVISKEGAYGRSQWNYRWGVAEGTSYRTRVIFKFTPDKTKVDIKTEAEYLRGNRWEMGFDTRLLETVKQDIMGVVSRVTM
jgi:hypothetical protein